MRHDELINKRPRIRTVNTGRCRILSNSELFEQIRFYVEGKLRGNITGRLQSLNSSLIVQADTPCLERAVLTARQEWAFRTHARPFARNLTAVRDPR